MKKKYHINQKGKDRLALIIWFIFTGIVVFLATQIYLQRIEDINNGDMVLVSNSECHK